MRNQPTRAISYVLAAMTFLMMVGGTVVTIVERLSAAEADIGSPGAYLFRDRVDPNAIIGELIGVDDRYAGAPLGALAVLLAIALVLNEFRITDGDIRPSGANTSSGTLSGRELALP